MQHGTVGFVSRQLLTLNFSEALSELFRLSFHAGMDGTIHLSSVSAIRGR